MSLPKDNEQEAHNYHIPSGAQESERLALQHELFRLTFNGKLMLAPISPEPTAILDIGCGTSQWAVEMATLCPSANVIGLDIGGQPQPATYPPNYTYQLGNFEHTWPFEDATFDYIHARFINNAMSKHKFVIAEALRCLKPGGWFETQEFYLPSPLSSRTTRVYMHLLAETIAKMGQSLGAPLYWAGWLRKAGFGTVREEQFDWYIGAREGETDERLRAIGGMMLANWNHLHSREFFINVFGKGAGWSEEESDCFMAEVRQDYNDHPGENIFPLNVVMGQKPS